jgi:ketosteroid isomerase-like protein
MIAELLAAVLLSASSPKEAAAVPGAARPADAKAIRAHVQEVFDAYRRKDRETVRRTHAADWRGFIRNSPGIVRGLDAYMAEAEWILASPAEVGDWTMRDFDVVFYGDVAVVSYVADFDVTFEGVRFPDAIRVVDVYARQGGAWNQVASQVATHPEILAARSQRPQTLTAKDRERLLADREAVWRAFFAGDAAALERALPDELVAVNAGEGEWQDRKAALAGSQAFRASGARLVRLEFPKTEIQVYGDTAILYTTYVLEIDAGGKRDTASGRGTEIFVRRDGRWVNAGWHLDSGR